MPHSRKRPEQDETKLLFDNYAEYARTFRTWMVAYGIGAPVLLTTNETVAARLAASPVVGTVVHLFLAGVGLQVLLALLNKWSAWHGYAAAEEPARAASLRYRLWARIGELSWLDLAIDVASLLAFACATVLAVESFLAPVAAT